MDVFSLRNSLVKEYRDFVESFLTIRDDRIRAVVDQALSEGLLWPEALVQLNPGFKTPADIDTLVDRGLLHEECRRIFRKDKSEHDPVGRPLRLYQHQIEAIEVARRSESYVLTSGTGSGKSLAYLIPIVDAILREGPGKGIRAIIVYPMNALANSQAGELHKFLELGFPGGQGPVRYKRYTGQESDEERQEIVANAPDILLTNYVMLELILTRPFERPLVQAARGLRFLVLDELHTYRGRQGADVAMLVRRVREACEARQLQCIGTSATLAGVDDLKQQRERVAEVATLLFGTTVGPNSVILETLQRVTDQRDMSDPAFVLELRRAVESGSVPASAEELRRNALACWVEEKLGIEQKGQHLRRAKPRTIRKDGGLAAELAELTGLDPERCAQAIEAILSSGFRVLNPETGQPMFAFRLHQFFTRGDTVYASLEPPESRYLTLREQQYVPGDRSRLLFPLAFCRECGQEYYSVVETAQGANDNVSFQSGDVSPTTFEPRDPRSGGEGAAYLYLPDPDEAPDAYRERIPDSWVDPSTGDVLRARRSKLPRARRVGANGEPSPDGREVLVIPSPIPFCLRCGVSYEGKERQDYARLATIGEGGRASATTILVAEALRRLKDAADLPQEARKVLSFTDNRQDASLQAGHFNDFVQVGLLRSALYRAVSQAGPQGLRYDELTQAVFKALSLPYEQYAKDPEKGFAARDEAAQALRDVLGYRLYRDLERGWRLTAPNLEQCGLLRFEYLSLAELCSSERDWQSLHPALAGATPNEREEVSRVLLDLLRRELAISVNYLESGYLERIKQRSDSRLAAPWAFDEDEKLKSASVAYPGPRRNGDDKDWRHVFISSRSLFGQYLRRLNRSSGRPALSQREVEAVIADLFKVLRIGGLVDVVDDRDEAAPGYQLSAASMVWLAGDGTRPMHDPLRVTLLNETPRGANRYFVDLYRQVADTMVGFMAGEHTAQVQSGVREFREKAFREGRLPVLFCSPTMELGVDIAELNVVNLRNVPPTPANYAQRSGRAGRRGQPALVFTYCSATSSHDQYFFNHPVEMVAGQVLPPQLDLANEDLLKAHVHAVWLAETGQDLGSSMADVLDVSGEAPSLELQASLRNALANPAARERANARCASILDTVPGLKEADWYHEGWLDEVLSRALTSFDAACDRWRSLYRAALNTREEQNRIIGDASRSRQDRDRAKRLRAEAESQLDLLRADTAGNRTYQSDFYSYRYFASEGFLPGYNFPRLPLSAFIPGRRGTKGQDDFLSRPRFLAIEEFGPRGIVYHEGARYVISRVLLPPSRTLDGKLITSSAKQCSECGYLHLIAEPPGPDLCERCDRLLDAPIDSLFRLENVSTVRRERITSDEEERVRVGYDVQTGIRFAEEAGATRARIAEVRKDEEKLATLTYSGAATLWRINLGWRRRKSTAGVGFWIDPERGTWQRREDESDDAEEKQERPRQRVVPYVEDRRNALLFEPVTPQDVQFMASLAAALKRAIQVEFQLEESELAVEPLPRREKRNLLLFYEAAEGGAGVLRRLVADTQAMSRVARRALEICHFDPDDGRDLGKAPHASENCEAACYDCLMSYTNQPDHRLLDRQCVRDFLLDLAGARAEPSPVATPRHEHLQALLNLCQTELERQWLRFVDELGLTLPTRAQKHIPAADARPDFTYDDSLTAVFVDGPVHQYPDVAARDREAERRLEDEGWTVVRFGSDQDTWEGVFQKWPDVFGRISR
ncbi:DEAD/DEAH box helicase [Tepidiforma thermophila]|uniref:ATP-dependent helicase YprA (DUF1998 family) n=1 Tax=Tepidiforma thermophila (strain KCTC 52669 / CGMCC 1.13589 / G233) TaxID=2761530 RepID=A0A2A9HID8_TEPT2|nr:DEAD/DEAH box helicase [Tepidiforma thermophila]PFG75153.1 ATP-dependent helicase YprA (DUF1998 family) [Tepidiforma thermophila]